VLIIALSGFLFTVVGVETISNLVVAEAEERVRNDLNTARLIYQDTLENVTQAAKFTAARTFIGNILLDEAVDPEYLDELARFKETERLDILSFTDDNGIVLLRIGNQLEKGDDQSTNPLIC
jgi:two-component system NtrC family sensor kinase